MENNIKLARMFRQIAALQEEQNIPYKPAAYRRAADQIEELPKDLSEYTLEVNELKKLPSIGEAIAQKIIDYFETGTIYTLDKLRMQQGGISAELMDIEGLGPKRVRQIQDALGITTVDALVKAAEEGKLRDLERFDEQLEQQILEHAKRVDERTKRFSRQDIIDDVEMLKKTIGTVPDVDRVEVAGSYRRGKATVGDIDILTVTTKPAAVSDAIAELPIVRDVAAHGDKKLSFDLHSGLRVDVRFVAADQWGSALLYFTGSKEHNIAMRKIAINKGWKLNEYGLFFGDNEVPLASKTEEEIYEKLELEYYEPTKREGGL